MRAPRHIAIALTALALSACSAGPVTTASPTTVLAAAEQPPTAPPELTPDQVRFLAAVAWQQAETRAFLEGVAATRAAVPAQLHRIMWCEAGRYLGLAAYETNYAAKTHGEEGASGGGQALGSTWRTWAAEVGIDVTRWPRAYLAPDWIQDKVLTHGYLTRGTAPWTPSSGCWR